jgi:ABC-2 type transport system ATP-binding protein
VIEEFAAAGGSVLLTSHYLEEVERLATQIVVLVRGNAIAEGSVTEIRTQVGLKRVSVSAVALPALPEVERTARVNGHQVLYTRDADDTLRRLVELRVPLDEIEVTSASLEEAFLALTADEACD